MSNQEYQSFSHNEFDRDTKCMNDPAVVDLALSESNQNKFNKAYLRLVSLRIEKLTADNLKYSDNWRDELSTILNRMQSICNADTKERNDGTK